jgi:hypothetical protein
VPLEPSPYGSRSCSPRVCSSLPDPRRRKYILEESESSSSSQRSSRVEGPQDPTKLEGPSVARLEPSSGGRSHLVPRRSAGATPALTTNGEEILKGKPNRPPRRSDCQDLPGRGFSGSILLGFQPRTAAEALTSRKPDVRRFVAAEGGLGKTLGLEDAWALRAVRATGNYAEIHERNLGVAYSTPCRFGDRNGFHRPEDPPPRKSTVLGQWRDHLPGYSKAKGEARRPIRRERLNAA